MDRLSAKCEFLIKGIVSQCRNTVISSSWYNARTFKYNSTLCMYIFYVLKVINISIQPLKALKKRLITNCE